MREARHAVLFRHAAERDHHQLLVIGRQIRVFENRRDFVLSWCHFVVPCLDRNTELKEFALAFEHESQHPLRNRAEIVVFEFLSLRRLGAEQRPAGGQQVGPGEEKMPIDQEVFLLGAGGGDNLRAVGMAEQLQYPLSLHIQSLHRAEHGRLLVERFAGPRDERSRNTERRAVGIFEDIGRAGHVPGRVTASFERRPDAARGEARRVGLALDQSLARELVNHLPAMYPSGARKLSCFSAVRPVSGKKTWA